MDPSLEPIEKQCAYWLTRIMESSLNDAAKEFARYNKSNDYSDQIIRIISISFPEFKNRVLLNRPLNLIVVYVLMTLLPVLVTIIGFIFSSVVIIPVVNVCFSGGNDWTTEPLLFLNFLFAIVYSITAIQVLGVITSIGALIIHLRAILNFTLWMFLIGFILAVFNII